jgi:hypothetical protein
MPKGLKGGIRSADVVGNAANVMRVNSTQIKSLIQKNAAEIVRLHNAIKDTIRTRTNSLKERALWEQACSEFHAHYQELAFPGGYIGALDRISSGDPLAMEAAVCFLELRPYFFRSGYMFTSILRRCNRAPLTAQQAVRVRAVEERLAEWKRRKNSN